MDYMTYRATYAKVFGSVFKKEATPWRERLSVI